MRKSLQPFELSTKLSVLTGLASDVLETNSNNKTIISDLPPILFGLMKQIRINILTLFKKESEQIRNIEFNL